MRALDEYERVVGDAPTVEGALHAFLDTDLDLYIQGGDGWKNYAALGHRSPTRQNGCAGDDGRLFRSGRAAPSSTSCNAPCLIAHERIFLGLSFRHRRFDADFGAYG